MAVQIDLLFYQHKDMEYTVLDVIDEATRWPLAEVVDDREADTILNAIVFLWFRAYDSPDVPVRDQEGAPTSEVAAAFLQTWQCGRKLKPEGAHAHIVERHHEIFRQTLHSVVEQSDQASLVILSRHCVGETNFAHNCFVQVDGWLPYQAVLGRIPETMFSPENTAIGAVLSGDSGLVGTSVGAVRFREIAVNAFAIAFARDRAARALKAKSLPAGQRHEF